MWRKILKWLGGLTIPAIGWVAALNGLPGIIQFSKDAATHVLPVWVLLLVLLAVAAAAFAVLKLRNRPIGKTDLRIVVLPTRRRGGGSRRREQGPHLTSIFTRTLLTGAPARCRS